MKSIKVVDLEIDYAEARASNERVVLLRHGWPYDIHSYVDVAPLFVSAGYRMIVPYLRRYGTARSLSKGTPRNGQQSALAAALGVEKAIIGGYGCGARTSKIMAVLWPDRCKAMVSVSGSAAKRMNKKPIPLKAELAWWYQFYFATERGRLGYQANTHGFVHLIWETASPNGQFDDAIFTRSAPAFDNPDHVAIIVHNYRWRLDLIEGESRFDAFEEKLANSPVITTPTITLKGDQNAAPHRGLEV